MTFEDRTRKRNNAAKPMHVRRVEKAVNLKPFLNSFDVYQISSTDSDEEIPDLNNVNIESILRGL